MNTYQCPAVYPYLGEPLFKRIEPSEELQNSVVKATGGSHLGAVGARRDSGGVLTVLSQLC